MPFYIVINRSNNVKEGMETFSRISMVLRNFLHKDVNLLGIVPDDFNIPNAVKRQIPFIHYDAKAPSSRALTELTERFCQQEFTLQGDSAKINFVARLKRFLFNR
jgi:flagellar biosynthesis protein FlhG